MARLQITGWKHRRNLSLLCLHGWSWSGYTSLARALSAARVNIPFLLLHGQKAAMSACICLSRKDNPQAEQIAWGLSQKHGWQAPQTHEPVIALTFYPLAGCMTLPAEVLACLARAKLLPLALGTSPAAVTMILPEGNLPSAVKILRQRLDLPPGALPPEEQISVVQSNIQRKD